MSDGTRDSWLSAQVMASALRLTNRPPSLLSPTARILKADIAEWVAASCIQSPPEEERPVLVVHRTTEPVTPVESQQLPLISSLPERSKRA